MHAEVRREVANLDGFLIHRGKIMARTGTLAPYQGLYRTALMYVGESRVASTCRLLILVHACGHRYRYRTQYSGACAKFVRPSRKYIIILCTHRKFLRQPTGWRIVEDETARHEQG